MSAIHKLELDTVVVSAEPSQSLIYDVVSVGIAIITVSFLGKETGYLQCRFYREEQNKRGLSCAKLSQQSTSFLGPIELFFGWY